MPAMPAEWMMERSSSGVFVLKSSIGCLSLHSSFPSGVMVISRSGSPDWCGAVWSPILVMVPDVGALTGRSLLPDDLVSGSPFLT